MNTEKWTDKPHNFFGLPINFTRYRLTDNNLSTQRGLLVRKEDLIGLHRIVDFSLEETLCDRLFRVGTIILHAIDADTPEKIISKVKDPRAVMALIEDAVKFAKTHTDSRDMWPTAAAFAGGCDSEH